MEFGCVGCVEWCVTRAEVASYVRDEPSLSLCSRVEPSLSLCSRVAKKEIPGEGMTGVLHSAASRPRSTRCQSREAGISFREVFGTVERPQASSYVK
ncbi:hypothetical protein BaRGS_00006468 [Batillaria attramentaria]|uniref:Uncharacterized protein n=1 Tax=Batillaria attramentaria TaxID=370345 RepID=A0ABD0LT71_9CAEN